MTQVRFGDASCSLSKDQDIGESDWHYLLTGLVTNPKYRRAGLASRLLEICKFIGQQDGLNIRLWAGPFDDAPMDMQALFEFYQRHGFEFFDPERPNWMEFVVEKT